MHGAVLGVRAADLAEVFRSAVGLAAREEGCSVVVVVFVIVVGLEGRASEIRELRVGCGDAADGGGEC